MSWRQPRGPQTQTASPSFGAGPRLPTECSRTLSEPGAPYVLSGLSLELFSPKVWKDSP